MTTVSGTSIQAAINAAAAGDTLDIAAGTYAGFRNTKRLNFRGDGVIVEGPLNTVEFTPEAAGSTWVGDVIVRGATGRHGSNLLVRANDITIDGLTVEENEAGYGVRAYQCDRLKLLHMKFRHLPFGVQFNAKSTDSVLTDFDMDTIDRMVVDDTAPGNDVGATGIDFFKTVGPITVQRGTMKTLRSLHSYDYGRDGSAFSVYGGARNVTVEDVVIRDALNVFEDGKASTDPDNANFIFRRIDAYGPSTVGTSKADYCQGVLVRSMVNMVWEDFEFVDLDGFGNFQFDKSGNYAGGLAGIDLHGGVIVLKPTVMAYSYNANVPMNAVTLADTVIFADPSKNIAQVAGKGQTNSLSIFRSWGAQATNEVWREPIVTVPPIDPCAPLRQTIAQYKDITDRAKAILAEENTLPTPIDRKALKSIINRADAVLKETDTIS